MGRPQFRLHQNNTRARAAAAIKPARDISELSRKELKERKKRLEARDDESQQTEIPEGYEKDCPKCGAEAGYLCWTPSGDWAKNPHAARL